MSDINTSQSGNVNVNWTAGVEQGQQEQTTALGFGKPFTKDTLHQMEGAALAVSPYIQAPGFPSLPAVIAANQFNQVLNDDLSQPPSQDVVNNALDQSLRASMDHLLTTGFMTQSQVAMVSFAVTHPDAQYLDINIREIANKVWSDAVDSLKAQFATAVVIDVAVQTAVFDQFVQTQYDQNFQKELQNFQKDPNNSNLDPSLPAKLLFAHYHPDIALAADPSLQPYLEQIENAAYVDVMQQCGLPSDWKGFLDENLDSTKFDNEVSGSWNVSFNHIIEDYDTANAASNGALDQYTKKYGLSSEQTLEEIKLLHNHPDAQFPGSDELGPIVKQIETNGLENIRSTMGIPSGYQPQINSDVYDGVIWGFYQNYMDQGYSQPEALSKVQQKFSLPVDWTPTQPSSEGSTPLVGKEQVHTAINSADTNYRVLTNVAQSMPDATKVVLLNFLKIIGEQLDKLKAQVYALESAKSDMEKLEAKIQMQMGIDKVRLQQDEQAKMEEKRRESGGKMSGIADAFSFLGPVMKPMEYITAMCMGGPAMLAFVICDDKFNLIDKAFQGIRDVSGKVLGAIFPGDSAAMKTFRQTMVVTVEAAALAAVCNMAIGQGGGMNMPMKIFQESGMLNDVGLLLFDGDQMKAAIFQASFMAAVAVTVFVVSFCMPGAEGEGVAALGEGGAEVAAGTATVAADTEKAAQEATTFSNIMEKVDQAAKWLLESRWPNMIQTGFAMAQTGAKIGQDIVTVMREFSLAAIAKIKEKYDAEIDILTSQIKVLEKVMNEILDQLSGLGGWIRDINDQQAETISSVSQTLSFPT